VKLNTLIKNIRSSICQLIGVSINKVCLEYQDTIIDESNDEKTVGEYFDLKKDCPNPKISSLGILISLAESEESSYENTLTQEERESYEEIIVLKRSFSSTMSYIPQSFSPEKEDYWKQLNFLLIVFAIIAAFPTIFIIFYFVMRFGFKKCAGPKKNKTSDKNVPKYNMVYNNRFIDNYYRFIFCCFK